MSKRKQTEPLEEYIRIKDEFKDQYQRKKQTQRNAKERRRIIREMKEDREWN